MLKKWRLIFDTLNYTPKKLKEINDWNQIPRKKLKFDELLIFFLSIELVAKSIFFNIAMLECCNDVLLQGQYFNFVNTVGAA